VEASALRRLAPPTLARVDLDRFLALGAAVGTVGWGVTALLAARPALVPDPALVTVSLWAVLVTLMVGVGVFATPDPVRFSRPILVWGPANAAATLVTLGVLFGPLPEWALTDAWALAGAVGYYASVRATAGNDRNVYLTAVFFEVTTFGTGTSPAVFVALGVCHVVPLVLVAFTDFRRAPYALGLVWLVVVMAATFL
jgi:hypothetical protein